MLPDEQFYQFIRESIASHDRQLGEITDDIAKLKIEMSELKESVGVLRDSVGELRDSVGGLRDSVGELRGSVGDLRDSVGGLAELMRQTLGVMKTLGETARDHDHRIYDLENPA